MQHMVSEAKVALLHQQDYSNPVLRKNVFLALDTAGPEISPGMNVLVKPNLLMARDLACTDPHVVAHTCEWLLEKGAKVTVADSPGFGSPQRIAQSIGLADALKGLRLSVTLLKAPARIRLPLIGKLKGRKIKIPVSRSALECDLIFSVAKIKAHSQMRGTACVKNCYGCVPGLAKAFIHARYGENHELFAAILAGLWASLPPVAAVADGIVAMTGTGPSRGEPFRLGLLGASSSAPALDAAIFEILGAKPENMPLWGALVERFHAGDISASPVPVFPLEKMESFCGSGFSFPQNLASASFNPFRLARSCFKRLWKRATC